MEYFASESIRELANPGVVSRQLLGPGNSSGCRVTVTEVHLEPGASQPRHIHEASEQIWYALQGRGSLLLAGGAERTFSSGDVVRFEEREVHGLRNDGTEPFVYLSVTAPPVDFSSVYREKR